MPRKRFEELDALRGLAAMMVVLFHYTMGKSQADLGFKLGTTGVDLFFIISGFVILLSLDHIKKSRDFIINRVSRLYPTYWASVTTTFFLIVLSSIYKMDFTSVSITQYLGNMTMFQFYLNIRDIDGPYWTMIIELLFYILMLFLFHFNFLKHINKIGITLSILILLLVQFQNDYNWIKTVMHWVPLLQFWPLFFTGILFYKLMTENVNLITHYSLILICLFSQVMLFQYSGRSNIFIEVGEYTIMLSLYFSTFILFVNGKLKFIISKPTLFLGKISFALYLIHQKISIGFIIPFLTLNLNLNFWFSSVIALIVSITIATSITYFIEVPLSKKMKRLMTLIFNSKNNYEN